VVDYHELEEYMEKNSPSLAEAKEILGKAVPAAAKTKSGDWEVQIPLVCPGHEQQLGPMKKPVYGRSCNHLEVFSHSLPLFSGLGFDRLASRFGLFPE